MSETARLSRNTLFSFLTMMFRLLTNVIVFWLIARIYGKAIFGQFTTAHTFATVFILFADFGLDVLLATELPRRIENGYKLFNTLFTIKIIFSVIAFLSMNSLAFFYSFSFEVKILISFFSFYVVFSTFTNYFNALFKGKEKLEYETRISFIVNSGTLIFTLIFIYFDLGILWVAGVFVSIRIIGLILATYYSYHLLPEISFKFDLSEVKSIKNDIIIFGVFFLFGNLFFQLDTILLAFWQGDESVGIYQSVFKLMMLPIVIPDIFVASLMPTLSRLNVIDKDKWKAIGFFFNKLLMIIAVPITIFIFLYAEQILIFIYNKEEFLQATSLMQIFAFILFIRFFCEAFGLSLTTSKNQIKRMYIVIFGTFLNFSLNYFLIPRYGPLGAGITSLATNLAVGILYVLGGASMMNGWLKNLRLLRFLFITVTVILLFLCIFYFNLWYLIPLPFFVYSILVYQFMISTEEKKYFTELPILKRKGV
ncbi:MAG: flippase [Bacteroidetes bacterium]|nr:flippase [Bacteroidota bacterium]